MIVEARRYGGRGWLIYDSAFSQQMPSLQAGNFSQINQSLYTTTFLAYGGRGQGYSSCMQPNHTLEEYALHKGRSYGTGRPERRVRWEPRRNKGGGKCLCFAWNEGRCTLPYCRFDHVCVKCYGDHRRDVYKAKGDDGGASERSQDEPRGKR